MTDPTSQPRALDLRKMRHSVQKRCYKAFYLLGGQPGLSKADQMIRLDAAIELLESALAKAKKAHKFVAERDFDAHLAAKQAKKDMVAQAETLPDSPEKAQEQLTFDQLIKQLSGMTPGSDQPQDNPPF
jgi:hypothetical protein